MKAKKDSPPVLLLDLHYGALQVGRCLGKRGIWVYGIDKSTEPVAASSRFIKCLDAPFDDEELKDFLIHWAMSMPRKPVLFPLSDYYLLFLIKYANILDEYFEYPYADLDIVQTLLSKVKVAALFERFSIPHPRTVVIEQGHQKELPVPACSFPCILKPEYHHYWEDDVVARKFLGSGHRVLLITDCDALKTAVERLLPLGDMVLQELIAGPCVNSYYYVGYRNREGQILLSYIGNKLRTLPDGMGSETLLKSVHEPELLKLGNEILDKTGYIGPVGIDFKYDSKDESFSVIEINPRIGINDCYLSKWGVDPAWIYYADALGINPDSCNHYPENLTWYDLNRDFDWMRDHGQKYNISWWSWMKDIVLRKYNSEALAALSDPVPFLSILARRCGIFLRNRLLS